MRKASKAEPDIPDLLPPPPPEPEPVSADPPSRMTRNELVYGLVVALELIVVAILNVVIKGGPGAPTRPDTGIAVIGIAISVAFVPLLFIRNRTVAGFGAIIAALFVSLPKVPNRLSLVHAFALIFPIAYALIVTQRQRRALKAQIAAGGGGPRQRARRGRGAPAESDKKKAKPAAPVQRTSGRYTPPKAKRSARR